MGFIFFAGWKSVESVPKLVEEYLEKKLKVDEFVTHTLPFEKINEGFELMHAGKRWGLHFIGKSLATLSPNVICTFFDGRKFHCSTLIQKCIHELDAPSASSLSEELPSQVFCLIAT